MDKSEFVEKKRLAKMRHELRTPMNHIIGYSEMLIEDTAGSEHEHLVPDLQEIRTVSERLLAIINDLCDPLNAGNGFREKLGNKCGEMHAFVSGIAGQVDALIERAGSSQGEAFIPDLTKIRSAANHLRNLIDNPDSHVENSQATIPVHTHKTVNQESQLGCLLLVDDNETNREMLSRRLEQIGYKVAVAGNGLQALDMLQASPFDLVLLDVMMPELDGYETLYRMKSDENLNGIPVIMISALDEMDSVVRCIEMGAEDYLPKPFNPVLLKARISASLEKKFHRDQEKNYRLQIEESNHHLQDLLGKVEQKNRQIMASINYAKVIQGALLPSADLVKNLLGSHFIIWEPKDIVGGDIYVVERVRNGFLIAAIDCTGHGVPGALMTMITVSAIKQIISEGGGQESSPHTGVERRRQFGNSRCCRPSEMLKRLNRLIKLSLYHQTDGDFRMDDGLEIGACWFDFYRNELTYCGSRFPLIVLHEGRMDVFEGNRQRLGYRNADTEYEFSEQTMPILPGQRFYLYSDGIIDQIGENGLPFGKRRLHDMIRHNAHLDMAVQKEVFGSILAQHQGNQKRRDDITLMGWESRPNGVASPPHM
ncbi:MAG: response regulator [Burkholderiales bacterium]|nr:response regulator [Burkholderiales bacterium]